MNLLKNCLIGEVMAPVSAADDTDENSDILDIQGYEGVVFVVPITDSVATGVATLTIEQNSSNSDSGMAALSGATDDATCTDGDDLNNTLLVVDVYRPRERYVQGVVTSTTANIAFGTMIAIRYGARKMPVTLDDTVQDGTSVFSPAEA